MSEKLFFSFLRTMSDVYRTRAIQMETRNIEIKAMHDEKTTQLIQAEKEIIYLRQQLIKLHYSIP